MEDIKDKQHLLEAMIGDKVWNVSKDFLQMPVDTRLPINFPNSIHYELYKNHIEFHIENPSYQPLCDFLRENLPKNEVAEYINWNIFGYRLKRDVAGLYKVEELGNAIIELCNIVEPVLLQYCEQLVENIKLANVLSDYYEKLKVNLPFHINVIDELHANENAHTRILTHLLEYKKDGRHIILESFLKLHPTFNVESLDIENSQIYFNKDNIDGLIEKSGEFAVIIENKIHWAVDQDKQIERYVNTERDKGIPQDRIWVIYLTRDGRKKVEGYSLTEDTKKILGDRFVEMDYYHHILPWLKEKVLPNCRVKEEWLESAIKQYIDHLEGLFGIRNTELNKKMQEELIEKIGCTKDMTSSDVFSKLEAFYNSLGELQNIVRNSMESLINPTIERLQYTTIKVLGQICPNEEIGFYNGLRNGFFQVFFKKWVPQVHFEWIPLNEHTLFETEYTLVLHIERDDLRESFKQVCNSDLKNKATEIGLSLDAKDRSVFYKHVVHTQNQKSMSSMTDEELTDFLKEAYKDVNRIQNFVSVYLFNKNEE